MPLKGLKGGSGVKPLGYGLGAAEEATDPNFNTTTLLLHADGSEGGGNTAALGSPNYKAFRDNSTSAHALVVQGDAYGNDFSPYYYANGYWSVFLSTNTSRIYTASSSDFDLGTSNFCYEGWIWADNPGALNYSRFFGLGPYYNDVNSFGVAIADNDVSDYITVYWHNGTSLGRHLSSTTTLPAKQWNHIAVVRDGSNFALFLNGTRIATYSSSSAIGSGNRIAFVGHTGNGSEGYIGYFSNVRLVKGSSVYDPTQTSLTVPTSPLTAITNTVFLVGQSNRFIDNSSSAHSLSIESVPEVSTNTPFTQSKTANVGSGFFDGDTTSTSSRTTTGDKVISASTSADWAFGTGDFTVECWVYPNGSVTDARGILSNREGGGNTYWALHYFGTTANQLHWHTGGTAVANSSPHIVTPNAWNHLAVTRESGTARMYINGVQVTTWSDSYNYSTSFYLDIAEDIYTNCFNGYITDVNIIKGTAKYTGASSFSIPTSTISADSNTKMLALQYSGAVRNVGFTDDSKYNHRISRNGDASMGTFSPFSVPDTYWSWYFDGNNPVEIADANNGLDLSGDFTLEFWAYEPKIATTGGTVNMYFTIDTLDRFQFSNNGSNAIFYINGGSVFSSTTPPQNQWNHIAVVRSGSGSNNISYYLNGTRQTQGTSTYSVAAASMMLGGQDRGGTTGYHGSFMYMSNFRILKGTALYSGASITVPTEPLTAITNTSLLTCQSSRFIDNSTNNMTLTTYLTKVIPFSPFAPDSSYNKDNKGGSVFFDGTDDTLQIHPQNDKDVFNPGSGVAYTLEGWVYPSKDTIGTMNIVSKGGTATGWDASNKHNLVIFFYNGSLYMQCRATVSFFQITIAHGDPYQWGHFALGYDGTTHNLWFNGTSGGTSTTAPIAESSIDGQNMFIGVTNDGTTSKFQGYITDVRYVRGTDVYGVGNSSITIPTAPLTAITNTQFLASFTNAGVIDHTGKNNLETEKNTRIRTDVKKFGTGSVFLDGSDELNINDDKSQTFSFGTGLFTVEAFIRVESGSGSSGQWFTNEGHGGWGTGGIAIYLQSAITVWFNDYNASSSFMSYDGNYDDGVMRHFVIVRGTSGACAIFVNGTRVATGTHTGNVGRTGGMGIGNYKGSSRYLTGFIDEMRVTKGVARYDPSQSSVTVPTEPFANR